MVAVSRSYNPYIDALLTGSKLSTTNLTYYFAKNSSETLTDLPFIHAFNSVQQNRLSNDRA